MQEEPTRSMSHNIPVQAHGEAHVGTGGDGWWEER